MTLESLASDAINFAHSNAVQFDEAALEAAFKKHFKPLCAYCQYRFGFELDLAKEAVHTGFIRLWENRESVSLESSVQAYLYRVVTNISLDMLKHEKVKQKYARHVSLNDSTGSLSRDFHNTDLRQLRTDIDKAVAELPEQMRRIFELSRYEELKYAEIALRLNISVKTVETQMSRALVKLRQKLSHYLAIFVLAALLNL
jgi:RNA polymerase sigma-70 factor, ECF subfamily